MLTVIGIAITGMLADRYPRHLVATGSYSLTIIGILALASLQHVPHWGLLGLFVLCFGLQLAHVDPLSLPKWQSYLPEGALHQFLARPTLVKVVRGDWRGYAGFLYDITGGYNAGFLISLTLH